MAWLWMEGTKLCVRCCDIMLLEILVRESRGWSYLDRYWASPFARKRYVLDYTGKKMDLSLSSSNELSTLSRTMSIAGFYFKAP